MEKLKLGVIGDPIGHTLSPAIQGAIAEKLGQPCSYEAFHVPLKGLPDFARKARRELDGFNITIPHKKNILPYLAELDPYAASCGAVNTVKIKGGALYGYNTDGDGLRAAMAACGVRMEGRKILLLGAGGAALSICRKALDVGAEKVTVLCRTPAKAAAFQGERVEIGELSPLSMGKCAKEAGVIINATPLGMAGIDGDFADFSFLDETKAAVCDIVYKPAETLLLKESRRRGLTAMNGLGMLIYQAVYAFAIFSDLTFDFDTMAAHVRRQVEPLLYGEVHHGNS